MGSGKGGGGGGGDPFPGNVREAQQLTDIQEAALGRALERSAGFNFFDVVTPFGQRRFLGTPGQPGFRQVESLSDLGRDIRNLGRSQVSAFGDIFSSPIGGLDLSRARDESEQAFFDRGQALLQPGFEREQSRLENQLVQRGIPRTSEAFTTEQEFLSDRQNRALENLALQSVAAGGQEQSRLLRDDIARRQGLLGELGFFSTGGMGPTFQATPNLTQQGADVMGSFGLLNQNIASQNALAQQSQSDRLGGLFGLGSAGILGGFGLFG